MEISIQIKEEKLSWRETDKSKEIENIFFNWNIFFATAWTDISLLTDNTISGSIFIISFI